MAKTNKEIVEEEIGKVKALDKECKCCRDDQIFLEVFGRAIAKAVRQEMAKEILKKYKSLFVNDIAGFSKWIEKKYLEVQENAVS